VDSAKPSSKDLFFWDIELKGFGLKVTPKGNRVFVVQYWSPARHRTRRRITLGAFGVLTVERARELGRQHLGRVANGADPAMEFAEKRRMLRDETLDQVSALFLEEAHAKMRPRSFEEYARTFRVNILPALGRFPLALLSSREVAALHLQLRDTPYQANRTVQYLRAFMNWAEARGYRYANTNPCLGLQLFPERSRERFLTVKEIGRLGAALAQAERFGLPAAPLHRKTPRSEKTARNRPRSADTPVKANPLVIAAIRLLLFTGWREQEVLTLRWTDVDLERGSATLPNTKTGKSYRPLGKPALALLKRLPRYANSPWVFPGARTGAPLREIQRTWYAARFAAGLSDVRLHDLRHTVASFAVSAGHSLYLTGKLLGHTRSESTQRYAHLGEDVRQATADSVSSAIARAMDGEESIRLSRS
jgi:integrase